MWARLYYSDCLVNHAVDEGQGNGIKTNTWTIVVRILVLFVVVEVSWPIFNLSRTPSRIDPSRLGAIGTLYPLAECYEMKERERKALVSLNCLVTISPSGKECVVTL